MKFKLFFLTILLVVIGLVFLPGQSFAKGKQGGDSNAKTIKKIGTAKLNRGNYATEVIGLEVRQPLDVDSVFQRFVSGSKSGARTSADEVPRVVGESISGALGGFLGITHSDQRSVDGGNKLSIEPPDLAIAVGGTSCTGSGECVVQSVNTAIAIFNTDGSFTGFAAGLNTFFGFDYEYDRTPGEPEPYGPFVTDPVLYYDWDTERFFLSVLVFGVVPSNGNFTGDSWVYIAVSDTNNPKGLWNTYSIDTINDGSNGYDHPGCPCFGDQPLIGADEHAFWVSTNEFPFFQPGFNGAQIYALDKAALASGAVTVNMQYVWEGGDLAEGFSYTVQPSTAPPGATYESANSGTQYFLSALDFFGTSDNRIAVWAATNTSSITGTPAISIQNEIIETIWYNDPPNAEQPDGTHLLKDALYCWPLGNVGPGNVCSTWQGILGPRIKEKDPVVASNDDRMKQVMYEGTGGNHLWGAITTKMKTAGSSGKSYGHTTAGIAWFAITPSWNGSDLEASLAKAGYVGLHRNVLSFPTIAVNADGDGVIAFDVLGPDYYPAAAYIKVNVSSGTFGGIKVPAWGYEPDDGFTGYGTFTSVARSRGGRWGDYTAASVVGDDVWITTQMIPDYPRVSILANWGTWIEMVTP